MEPKGRPKRVRVGTKVYQIVSAPDPRDELLAETSEETLTRSFGKADHLKLLIYLNTDYHEDQIRDTLLHEIVHTAEHAADLDLTEHQVTALSTQLLGILQGNPRVVDYLTKRNGGK